MNAHPTVGQSDQFAGPSTPYYGALVILVILALAGTLALGASSVLDRVIATGVPSASTSSPKQVASIAPFTHVVDRWYDEPEGRSETATRPATTTSIPHVVDRWFDEPTRATTR